MHSFEVHSNESACRKSGRLGLEQVFRITVFSRCFGLVSCAFLAETALFIQVLQITVDGSIFYFIANCPLIPPLWLHLCTNFANDLLLLAVLILDNVDNKFNHCDGCIMVQ